MQTTSLSSQGPVANQVTAAAPELSEDERSLVEIAMRQLDNTFPIAEVYRLGRYSGVYYSKDRVNDLAKQWELRGWLSPVQRDPKTGIPRARKIAPEYDRGGRLERIGG